MMYSDKEYEEVRQENIYLQDQLHAAQTQIRMCEMQINILIRKIELLRKEKEIAQFVEEEIERINKRKCSFSTKQTGSRSLNSCFGLLSDWSL